MRDKKVSIGLTAALAIFAVTLFVTGTAASQEKVLHSFNDNGSDGYGPAVGLIFDTAGNLYGTTEAGGSGTCSGGCGTVFGLARTTGGAWREKVLYSFKNNGRDGIYPVAALVLDASGNLYGTTTAGGSGTCSGGCGTVFELTPTAGRWTEKVLYSFKNNGRDGTYPYAGVTFDASGDLYGTTYYGGGTTCNNGNGCGTVFELAPTNGSWTEAVRYAFQNNGTDGYRPYAVLTLDVAGSLYGTTEEGGSGACSDGCGTVFELTPSGGSWTETILHSFNDDGTDGIYPAFGQALIFDASGDLYGTTTDGGSGCGGSGCGAVFELTPSGGSWTETILHNFNDNGRDGTNPFAGLTFDTSGNLYGTTAGGGVHSYGTAFELTPVDGNWAERVYGFNGNGGSGPAAGLIFDGNGNLYGTTSAGGAYNHGTVFEITP